jgi:pimeloyl-ACP methyl ester carboxylesterase
MDELASQILFVMSHFGLKTIIGFGIGAGANILVRFALANPDKVGALCLVNCSSTQAGWIEWGYQSMNTRNLRSKGMTQGVLDYLMWHHFGRAPEERNLDLVSMYKSYFERSINPINLVSFPLAFLCRIKSDQFLRFSQALFIDSYVKRTDMNIARTPSGTPQAGELFNQPF